MQASDLVVLLGLPAPAWLRKVSYAFLSRLLLMLVISLYWCWVADNWAVWWTFHRSVYVGLFVGAMFALRKLADRV